MGASLEPGDVAAAIASHGVPPPEVRSVRPLGGGACQDNFLVELADRRMILRSDARRSLPLSLRRKDEYQVVCRAVAAGVKTPAARWLTADLCRPGSHAYFLEW